MSILCEPQAFAQDRRESIGDDVRAADTLAVASQMLESDPAEILVVIGAETAADEALAFAATLRLARPTVGVVLMRDKIDVALLSRALQSGVREVVRSGDENALTAACRRSRELSRRLLAATGSGDATPATRGQVITVFAAKGGCGKTTVAINLGVALHDGGRHKVCVVDTDLAFGDVAISVRLDPVRTLVDGLPMVGHLDATGAASLLTTYRPGLEFLLAPAGPGEAEKVPPPLIGELLAVLRGMFDYVVIDTAPHLSEHVLTALDASSHHVLLTAPDVPTLKNLRITLDMLDLLAYPPEIRSVVLNRSDAKAGLTEQDVGQIARWPISARIPSSRAVPVSINRGTPITLASPGHPVSQAIVRFAEQLMPAQDRIPRTGLFRSRRRSA